MLNKGFRGLFSYLFAPSLITYDNMLLREVAKILRKSLHDLSLRITRTSHEEFYRIVFLCFFYVLSVVDAIKLFVYTVNNLRGNSP